MKIIDRYIYAVVSKLPEKQREDIAKELRTLIDDMMGNYSFDEAESSKVEKVLLELGDPNKLANKYIDKKRYLIGPENFSKYIFVLKIVLLAIFIGISVALVVEGIFVSENNLITIISDYFSTLTSALFQGFTWVTVIFATVEYQGINFSSLDKGSKWDLSKLSPIPNKKSLISPVESLIGILFTTIFTIIIYFVPEVLAAYFLTSNDSLVTIPIFNIDALSEFKFIIIGIFILCITKEMLKILYGKWSIKLAVSYSVLTILSLILFIILFSNPTIWNANFLNEISSYVNFGDDFNFSLSMSKIRGIILSIIIFFNILDIIIVTYKGIKYNEIVKL